MFKLLQQDCLVSTRIKPSQALHVSYTYRLSPHFVPLALPLLLDWLSMSSNRSSRMAVTVLVGVVTGMLILTLLPWQVTALPPGSVVLGLVLAASSLGLPSLPESPNS
jgi:hypothetical protein